MIIIYYCLLLFITFDFVLFISSHSNELSYDLPLFPSIDNIINQPPLYNISLAAGKHIPRNAWIAVRDLEDIHNNVINMQNRNPNWIFKLCDNQCKDEFMEYAFQNTSILWAYHAVNPKIAVTKVEIWRLAVLWTYGGMYIDDDAIIEASLDTVVQPDDKFIIGPDSAPTGWDDKCWTDDFPISNKSLNQRFGDANLNEFFQGKYLVNWLIFSAKYHPIIERSLSHSVNIIKNEFLCQSSLRLQDHRGAIMLCSTCYTITMATRELILEKKENVLGLHLTDIDFREYGGNIKSWYSDYKPNHWIKLIHAMKIPYLRHYNCQYKDGTLIQTPGDRHVYFMQNGSRKGFPGLGTFIAMGLDFDNVTMIPSEDLENIPYAGELPKLD